MLRGFSIFFQVCENATIRNRRDCAAWTNRSFDKLIISHDRIYCNRKSAQAGGFVICLSDFVAFAVKNVYNTVKYDKKENNFLKMSQIGCPIRFIIEGALQGKGDRNDR